MDCGNGDKNIGCKLVPLIDAVSDCAVTGTELWYGPYANQIETPIRRINNACYDGGGEKNVKHVVRRFRHDVNDAGISRQKHSSELRSPSDSG